LNKRGFTLIELLVAAALFLVTITAFNYILKAGAATVDSGRQLQQAACTIQQKMEELRASPFGQLTLYHGHYFAAGKGKISVVTVMVDLVKIDLQLDWHADKAPLKLTTLRSKYQ
jgi:prepilin-type N-terminal cleavage/methylation domain-containing protein